MPRKPLPKKPDGWNQMDHGARKAWVEEQRGDKPAGKTTPGAARTTKPLDVATAPAEDVKLLGHARQGDRTAGDDDNVYPRSPGTAEVSDNFAQAVGQEVYDELSGADADTYLPYILRALADAKEAVADSGSASGE